MESYLLLEYWLDSEARSRYFRARSKKEGSIKAQEYTNQGFMHREYLGYRIVELRKFRVIETHVNGEAVEGLPLFVLEKF